MSKTAETSPELELSDVIEQPVLKGILDNLYALTRVPLGIVDRKGRVLAGVGWQDICTRFHRVHPVACRNCIDSDTRLTAGITPGEHRLYRCRNGLWDAAAPIIVNGRQLGNIFIGQFFFRGEPPDRETFKAQAALYGFPEKEYLEALDRVAVLDREHVAAVIRFLSEMARNLSRTGWSNWVLARNAAETRGRERELHRVNRMLVARSRSDRAMVRATSEQEFLDEVCRIIVEACGHSLVWIGLVENDEKKSVRLAAFSGCARGDLSSLNVGWGEDEANGRGPTGLAVRTGRPSVCQDIRLDPGERPWREQALKLGCASSAVLPLMSGGKAIGVLAVYSAAPGAFTEDEVRLLEEVAEDVSFGVETLRIRDARKEAEARFQKAQKLEAVGLLAAGVAHDFNNILATIIGYNAVLLEELKDKRLRSYGLEVKHSAELAATLTRQLLGVSGRQVGPRRVLDAASVVAATAKMMRRMLGEKIRVELKLGRDCWPVEMDGGQLEQIVMNLVVNARDAMPDGGRLTLATRNVQSSGYHARKTSCRAPKGRWVVLEVRDNGIGMDAELQGRIFEPFFTTKAPGRGTGLGLSAVKSIVQDYGGHITVDSKPGRGTVFRIHLPAVAAPEASPEAAAPAVVRGPAGRAPRETVLVVEDNASLLVLIRMTLQRAGYRVQAARSAEEAEALFAKADGKLDLLLTDVVLPDMDGPELAKRAAGKRPGLRTVFMSGYAGGAADGVLGSGDCALLEKPFTPEKLLSVLREVLDDSATGGR